MAGMDMLLKSFGLDPAAIQANIDGLRKAALDCVDLLKSQNDMLKTQAQQLTRIEAFILESTNGRAADGTPEPKPANGTAPK